MQKRYIAYWDDGCRRGTFTFYSEHRARSKRNFADASAEAAYKYGRKAAQHMSIYHSQIDNIPWGLNEGLKYGACEAYEKSCGVV